MQRGKRYRNVRSAIERERLYSPADAVRLLKDLDGAKFDETVEAHFNLGLNVRHADQQLRGTISLPHGTGREQRIAVFAEGEKAREVAELAERLRNSDTLIVADYRGLTMPQIDALRGRLLEHGVEFHVVKNTLTRRAAEEAGADAVLALLEGPTAIAFLEAGGDPVAVAKALRDVARDTRILAIRGGVLEGRTITAEEVESLATLPPADVLRAQLVGAVAG